jgi:hypothetical protein
MPVSVETVEHYEARFEAFLAVNPQITALDDAAILNAMPPEGAMTGDVPVCSCELPY